MCIFSEVGISGVLLNTTNTWSVNNSDVDIAVDTPERAPRVSNNVVWSIDAICSITNDNDSVVKFETASIRVEDTAGVELEDQGVSFECY